MTGVQTCALPICCDKERRFYGDKNHASFGRKEQYIGWKARRRPRPWRPLYTAALSAAIRRLRERSERTAAVRRRPGRYCRERDTKSRGRPYPAGRRQHVSQRGGNSRDRLQPRYRRKTRPGRSTADGRAAASPETGAWQRGTGTSGSTEGRSEIFCAARLRNGDADRPKPIRWDRRYKRPRRGSGRRRCSQTEGSAAASANSSCTAWYAAAGWYVSRQREAGNRRIPEIVCRVYSVRDSYWLGFVRAFQYPNQHTAGAGGKAHSPGWDAQDFPAARSYRYWSGRTPFVWYGRNTQSFQFRTAARWR